MPDSGQDHTTDSNDGFLVTTACFDTLIAVRFGNVKCVDKADITGIINTIRQVRSYALKKARGLKKLIVCLI